MRIVLKLGTSTLTHPTGNLNIRRVEELCKVCSDLKNAGHELVLVSSGAVAMGVGKLSLAERPKDIPGKQAAAAVGQCELMYIYDKLYSQYHHVVAQLLITADDIETPERAKNFHREMEDAEKALDGVRIKVPDEETDEVCELCGRKMVIKSGRFGRFLACPGFPARHKRSN